MTVLFHQSPRRPALRVRQSRIRKEADRSFHQTGILVAQADVDTVMGWNAFNAIRGRNNRNTVSEGLKNFHFHATASFRSVKHDTALLEEWLSIRDILDDFHPRCR